MTKPNRYHIIALQVAKLPPELVHEIIGDLPIVKLLELISNHEVPYIDHCICSHIHLGAIFSADFLVEVKAYFVLYLRIRRLDHRQPHPELPQLDHDAVAFGRLRPPVNIVAVLNAAIMECLEKYEPLFPLLQAYAPQPIPPKWFWVTESGSGLQEIFEMLDAAEANLNAVKSAQLKRMAELIERYPGALRTRGDLSQERRHNEKHIVDRLLQLSGQMQRRQILSGKYFARTVFAYCQFFLVPYDRLLRLFLKTMKRFPPIFADTPSKNNAHEYPSQIKLVIEGLPSIYSRDVKVNKTKSDALPRTLYTIYSAKETKIGGGSNQPCFWASQNIAKVAGVDLTEALQAASNQELEWLEGFLSICQYMAGMEEEWKKGQTVREYWLAHCA